MERARIIQDLEAIVGKQNILSSEMQLNLYNYDASLIKARPDCIVLPRSTEDVSRVVRYAHENAIPVVARGAGTNLSGGSVPTRGGIVLHFPRMNRILEIDVANQRVVVEPGAITLDIKNAIGKVGYLYHPDPASEKATTIGGNAGENSGGPHCFKYGVTSNHVLGLELVLADGEAVEVGGKALDAPGYDLTGIMVGSEGTLAIVTKLILRMVPKTEAVKTMLAIYDTVEDGANAVSAIIAAGIIPATLEMMDNLTIKAVEEAYHVGFPLDAAAILLIEVDGLKDGLERQAELIVSVCRDNHVREVRVAKDEAERLKIWAGRKGAFGAVGRLRPNYLVNDGTVPRTKLPETLKGVIAIGQKYRIPIANVFHAGDGNLHPLMLFDERDKDELDRVHQAAMEIMKLCVDMGGTISGEHGIGVEKLEAMSFIFNDDDLQAMGLVKKAFDPDNICNPGKLIPAAGMVERS
ncbi:MAG: FAD-linked oxidase C-terminal domain-containing protein [Smithellaceae bacterium]|nr:FAD-linked oxidase C-terminal domain-containing protein [Smithellaceae bacterium]